MTSEESQDQPLPDEELAVVADSTETLLPASRTLQEAIERLELQVPAEHLPQLEAYCGALWEWNTKINLTRHTDFDLFARRDLLDTVRLANHIEQGEEVLDIGTGGGVPGLVLAIIRPDLTVSVCDGVAKTSSSSSICRLPYTPAGPRTCSTICDSTRWSRGQPAASRS